MVWLGTRGNWTVLLIQLGIGERNTTELVPLLLWWHWQLMQAARNAGASWQQIGAAAGLDARRAETECTEATQRQADVKRSA